MSYSVSPLSIVFIIVAMFFGVLIPVGLFLYFRAKKKADVQPFFIGCAVFIVFALILKNLAQYALAYTGAWTPLQSNPWLYGLVGGLFAGVFEEAGRFTAFKTVLRKRQNKDINALMYGAGHGGFEVIMILVLGMATNLIYALLINAGQVDALLSAVPEASQKVYETMFQTLSDTDPAMFLVSVLERFAAVILQLSLSVFVWFAAKNKKVFWLFPAAIAIHTLVDMFAVALQQLKVNILIIELVVFLIAGLCVVLALAVWRKNAVAYVPPVAAADTAPETTDDIYNANNETAVKDESSGTDDPEPDDRVE